MIRRMHLLTLSAGAFLACPPFLQAGGEEKALDYQYRSGEISIPVATAHEPLRSELSWKQALSYLDNGALAWSRERKCVSCHTNGTYLVVRPELTSYVGRPSREVRDWFVAELEAIEDLNTSSPQEARFGIVPTQVAYIAGGLARWDAHVSGQLSAETDTALRLMFELQAADGSWSNDGCWPPFESSGYQSTTVAARAAAAAPGWLEQVSDERLLAGVARMKAFLRETEPPHDYGRVLLLWTAASLPDLLDEDSKMRLIEMIWQHQLSDGGWSLRTFAAPEAWGDGGRAGKLRAEAEFENPSSDGHQTGLAVIVLREAGVSATDPRIQRAVGWLTGHQRESGRWWTRSLNTDRWHFITYSGTGYPLLALARCGVLRQPRQVDSRTAPIPIP